MQTAVVTFGGSGLVDAEQVYAITGRYADDAAVWITQSPLSPPQHALKSQ